MKVTATILARCKRKGPNPPEFHFLQRWDQAALLVQRGSRQRRRSSLYFTNWNAHLSAPEKKSCEQPPGESATSPLPYALLPHVRFYPFCSSAGGSPGALLRTQINGTCCNAGSRHLRPFSPLLTPTHPLNSGSILTNCSNDQVALPGRGKMAGPVPRHTRAALFTPCSLLRPLCCTHRALTAQGDFSPGGLPRPAAVEPENTPCCQCSS